MQPDTAAGFETWCPPVAAARLACLKCHQRDAIRAGRAAIAARGDRVARCEGPFGAADLGRHRPDADDEGGHAAPVASGEPGQARPRGHPDRAGRRAARWRDDWPAVGVAVCLDFQGDSIREASVVIGAATDRPTRLAAVERILVGRKLDENLLDEAATQELSIEGDLHGSAVYKKQLIRVYLRRAIHEARAQSR